MTLDLIGKRYSKLPSEVLKSGSSIDVQIANIGIRYEAYLTKKAQNNGEEPVPELTESQMLEMVERVKNKDVKTTNK